MPCLLLFLDICAHKLPKDLRRRFVLDAACFQKLLPQIALNSYAKADIFHAGRV